MSGTRARTQAREAARAASTASCATSFRLRSALFVY
eukprot:CAMPEP_0185851912 /NCGR_PEP_ID=MMETSP1354-20130828/12366_1 /TAXON_ID=708628 /ORGANISM="Erythrolobus madagascarensis, Strain CCMP3276" /LENGTH=35 /DNA_ID= /DNA_START= /DNA_END= /DNA_ORIENTATION=